MSFLRVSDLLLISVVINHDVGSLLLHEHIMFSFKIIDKFLLEKCVCSSSNILTAWYPAYRLKMKSSLCLCTKVTLCPNMDERCRYKKFHFYFILLVSPLPGTPSCRVYPKIKVCIYEFCDMKHSCDNIPYINE